MSNEMVADTSEFMELATRAINKAKLHSYEPMFTGKLKHPGSVLGDPGSRKLADVSEKLMKTQRALKPPIYKPRTSLGIPSYKQSKQEALAEKPFMSPSRTGRAAEDRSENLLEFGIKKFFDSVQKLRRGQKHLEEMDSSKHKRRVETVEDRDEAEVQSRESAYDQDGKKTTSGLIVGKVTVK